MRPRAHAVRGRRHSLRAPASPLPLRGARPSAGGKHCSLGLLLRAQPRPAAPAWPWSRGEAQPHRLNRNLHFNKMPRVFLLHVKFEPQNEVIFVETVSKLSIIFKVNAVCFLIIQYLFKLTESGAMLVRTHTPNQDLPEYL